MMDQQKLCISGNSIFWQKKQSKVPYVQNESTEIICIGKIISKSEAK